LLCRTGKLPCPVSLKRKENQINIFDNPQLKKKYGKDWEEEHK